MLPWILRVRQPDKSAGPEARSQAFWPAQEMALLVRRHGISPWNDAVRLT